MSKAIILGGGGGAPRNSVKVSEYAGEDIPANYFVSKREGIIPYSSSTNVDTDTVPIAILQVSENFELILSSVSSGKAMKSVVDNKLVSSAVDTRTFASSYNNNPSIVHLKSQRKVIWTYKNTVGEATSLYFSVWEYDFDGNITLITDSSWSEYVDTRNLNSGISLTEANFISGEYSTDWFYVICANEAANPYKFYLQKWRITNSGFEKMSSFDIDYGSARPSSCARTSPAYFESVKFIIFSASNYPLFNLESNELVSFNGIASVKADIATALSNAGLFRGMCCINSKNKKMYSLTSTSLWKTLYITDFGEKTMSLEVLTSSNPPTGSGDRSYGLVGNPLNTNELFTVVTGQQLAKINVSEKTLELIGRLSSSYSYASLVLSCLFSSKSTIKIYLNTVQSSTRYTYIAEYALGAVEIAKDKSTIYGISQMNIKAYEQGTIYALSDMQTVSVYGIRQDLADTIVDDGITEVQNAVLDGKEQN